MFALRGHVAARQHVVDRQPQEAQRILEPREFLVAVLVEQVGDDDARLVQHHVAEPDAVVEWQSAEADRPPQVEFEPRPGQPLQVARGDHLGDHHRRGFQRLDLVVAIVPHGAVLHHEHAQRAPGSQDRNTEEGVVDFLAGLRKIGEGGMLLRVGQIQGACTCRDRTDETLAEPQLRQVHGAGVEAFRRVQLEHRVGPQHIERAHFRDHVLRDLAHDPVEPLLGLQRLGHQLAQTLQEHARAGCHGSHRVIAPTVCHGTACAAPFRPGVNEFRSTAYPDRRRNAKSEPRVRYRDRRSGSRS